MVANPGRSTGDTAGEPQAAVENVASGRGNLSAPPGEPRDPRSQGRDSHGQGRGPRDQGSDFLSYANMRKIPRQQRARGAASGEGRPRQPTTDRRLSGGSRAPGPRQFAPTVRSK